MYKIYIRAVIKYFVVKDLTLAVIKEIRRWIFSVVLYAEEVCSWIQKRSNLHFGWWTFSSNRYDQGKSRRVPQCSGKGVNSSRENINNKINKRVPEMISATQHRKLFSILKGKKHSNATLMAFLGNIYSSY